MEGAQDTQAVLRAKGQPRLTLRLEQAQSAKAKWLPYALLLVLLLYYPLAWAGCGPRLAAFFAFALYIGASFIVKKWWLAAVEIGQLLCFADALVLTVNGQHNRFSLDASTQVRLSYQGFKNEQLAPRIWASGVDNFIRINGGETYCFAVPTERVQTSLRAELRRWYLGNVAVKEHRRDGPTFLLHRDLSYEQIQAYKKEFGVELYG